MGVGIAWLERPFHISHTMAYYVNVPDMLRIFRLFSLSLRHSYCVPSLLDTSAPLSQRVKRRENYSDRKSVV